jgi:ribose transport system ATP-binding protein
MGRNGCGKSTLLKIICGVYQADRGRVIRARRITRSSNSASAGILSWTRSTTCV